MKVQGYRVELEEIEAILGQHPGVRNSVVTALGQAFGNKRLVAYVVPRQDPPPAASELARFLGERLPTYMVPSAYVMLDHLPLSPNGKVDRRALPEPAAPAPSAPKNPAPSGRARRVRLAKLVAGVLKLPDVDPDDSLFDLGATSIDMIRIVATSPLWIVLGTWLFLRDVERLNWRAIAGAVAGSVWDGGDIYCAVIGRDESRPYVRFAI